MSQFSMRLDPVDKTELEQSIEDADKGNFSHTYDDISDFRKHLINESKNH